MPAMAAEQLEQQGVGRKAQGELLLGTWRFETRKTLSRVYIERRTMVGMVTVSLVAKIRTLFSGVVVLNIAMGSTAEDRLYQTLTTPQFMN
jgi:hypothetical protein